MINILLIGLNKTQSLNCLFVTIFNQIYCLSILAGRENLFPDFFRNFFVPQNSVIFSEETIFPIFSVFREIINTSSD